MPSSPVVFSAVSTANVPSLNGGVYWPVTITCAPPTAATSPEPLTPSILTATDTLLPSSAGCASVLVVDAADVSASCSVGAMTAGSYGRATSCTDPTTPSA